MMWNGADYMHTDCMRRKISVDRTAWPGGSVTFSKRKELAFASGQISDGDIGIIPISFVPFCYL